MGQAKQRGNRDQRIAKALGLRERSLSDIKMDFGLADDAKFLGYAVHLVERDEFLAAFECSDDKTIKAWSDRPDTAMCFETLGEAFDIAEQCRDSVVICMFDIGDQIMVYNLSGK